MQNELYCFKGNILQTPLIKLKSECVSLELPHICICATPQERADPIYVLLSINQKLIFHFSPLVTIIQLVESVSEINES